MSKGSIASAPPGDSSEEDFPTPDHFVLSPVRDGSYSKGLPTITAVYLGCLAHPIGHFLMGMVCVSLDPHETDTAKLLLHLFIQPEDEDLEEVELATVFSETCAFELKASQKIIDEFTESVQKIKAFTLAISTDEYYFTCRVDSEATTVTDVKCDWRFLN